MSYCFAQTSLAHTYGNMASFVTEYIKSLFPKNYFSTVHINSALAFKQISLHRSLNKEIFKKSKPMLIIRPRIEFGDTDVFLSGTYLTNRITDNYMEPDLSNLQKFFIDTDKGLEIKFLLNRLKMSFDISIITETQLDQINQANFLQNRIRQNRPFFLYTSLESYIPRDLVTLLSKDTSISMTDENGSIKTFVDYFNAHSIYPLTYKIKNSSGNNEFFRFYPAEIDTMFTGLSIDDGSKKGQVFDQFVTTFTMTTEFYSAGFYYYFSPFIGNVTDYTISINADDTIIPIFTVPNIYSEKIGENWEIYISIMYTVNEQNVDDELDISGVIDEGMKSIIETHIKEDMDLNRFMAIFVMKDNIMLTGNTDYELDLTKFILTTHNGDVDSTYRFVIQIDRLYVNNYISERQKLYNDK
jgi:hypothetical protein